MNWPLTPLGRARTTLSIIVSRLSKNLVLFKAGLADGEVHEPGAVEAVLDAALLGLFDDSRQVVGLDDGTRPGVRHEATPSEIPSEPSDLAHHVGGGDCYVEVDPSALDALDEVVVADEVRACLLGDGDCLAVGEYCHAQGLADAVGKHGHASNDLIGVAGVGPGANVKLNGLIELGGGGLLDQFSRFGG